MNERVSSAAGLTLKDSEFRQISELAYKRFGLDLRRGKEALVAARLGKRLREHGFSSFGDYYRQALSDSTGETLVELIDSLTTNHTSFFREPAHFEFLAKAAAEDFRELPSLEIWCAASSTGEEPYSIAMSLTDLVAQRARPRSFQILATDISTRVLGIARRAVYAAERFEGLNDAWKKAHLLRGEGPSAGLYKVKPEIAKRVTFDRLNLIEPFRHGRHFHIIFCRNVLMYFDKPTQRDIVQRLGACLELGGYLMVGHSESLTGVEHGLNYVRPAVYQREKVAGLRGWL